MPSYDFKCPVCSQATTIKAGFDESFVYPSCQWCLVTMERVWTANPIHFKGTGWGGDK